MAVKSQIMEQLGNLTADPKADVTKEITLSTWNEYLEWQNPVYDIRSWKTEENERKPLKDITLTAEELKRLRDVLNRMKLE